MHRTTSSSSKQLVVRERGMEDATLVVVLRRVSLKQRQKYMHSHMRWVVMGAHGTCASECTVL